MKKLFSMMKPYRIAIGVALFFMLTELIVELIHPLLMAKIIDDGIMQKDLAVVIKWGGIMLGLSSIAFASGILNSYFAAHVSQSYGFDVRQKLYEKVQSFSIAIFDRLPASSLITRMTNDITFLQNSVFMGLRIMLRAPLIAVGGIFMAVLVNVKLAIILVLLTPILLSFLLWAMKKGGGLFRAVQQKLDGVNSVMRENLAGMRLIKAFLRKEHEVQRFTAANTELKDQTVTAFRLMELTMPVLLLVMNFGILGILWFGHIQVRAEQTSVGEVVAIVNYATRVTAAFSILSWIIMAFSRAKASAERVSEVLDSEVDLVESKVIATKIIESNVMNPTYTVEKGYIQFKEVSFRYPGTSEPVLHSLSFEIEAGQRVAILGATGSGKSSLLQLLPRLYEANEGEIRIDGIDIRHYRVEYLRRVIGFVPQESLLFSGTIKENIAWGKEDASLEEVMTAAEHAQISETIEKMRDKYDTLIGQKGVTLSGGQKQRISIARALIRKPKILLLDDSTSALDLRTESRLLGALKQYSATTLIITQKISTAIQADKILLLDDGRLINEGTHQDLLSRSALYQQIYESQFGKENSHYVQGIK